MTVNWGDGTPATSFQVSSQGALGFQAHAYELPGTYLVTVTVIDVYGLSGSDSFTTTVAPVAPSPQIQGAPTSMNAGSSVTLGSSVIDFSQAETALGYTYAWSVLLNGTAITLPNNPATNGPNLAFDPDVSGTYTIGLTVTDASGSIGTAAPQTIVVNDVAPSLGSISAPATVSSGVAFSVSDSFTDPDPNVTHTAVWNWGDSTTSAGTVTEPSGSTPGQVAGSHTYTMAGTYTITLKLTGRDGLTAQAIAKVGVNLSIIVLDPTAGGALSLSGNASINVPGIVAVNSSATTALSASGNASVTASSIEVVGKVKKSGNASFHPAPTTGAAAVPNPLSGLSPPGTSGMTNHGAESLSGNAKATIQPGIYSKISASGNAKLTLAAGIYIIEGGGLTISGNASITGTGVMIVNAGSNYPKTCGSYGSISLSGNGSYNLSPPTSGTYAGIVIFQPKDNTKTLTLSGNAAGMSGTLYAPAAKLSESGNAQLDASLIVDTLTISGNGTADGLTLESPDGTTDSGPTIAAIGSAGLVEAQATSRDLAEVFRVVDSVTLASFLEGTEPLTQDGGSPDAPRTSVPSGPGSGRESPDPAAIDGIMALDTTTSAMNPMVRIRTGSPGVPPARTYPASFGPQAPAVDAATVDALLGSGWRTQSSWVADRPRESIKGSLGGPSRQAPGQS